MKPVSVEQVAKRAGVAKSTVSFVLNNKGNVSPVTREKVLASIKELGYTKDRPRARKSSDTPPPVQARETEKNIVAYINPKIRFTEAANGYISGLRQWAKTNNFSLTLAITGSELETENQFLFIEQTAEPSGVVIIGVDPDEAFISKVLELKVPGVIINRITNHPDLSFVAINHEEAGHDAARYLLGLGHRQFLFMVEPDYNRTEIARLKGFMAELAGFGEQTGIALVRQLLVNENNGRQTTSEWSSLNARERLGKFVKAGIFPFLGKDAGRIEKPAGLEVITFAEELKEDFQPSCVVASNDGTAVEAEKRLMLAGLSIPEDVSVMGFNNRAIGLELSPQLSTIDELWPQQGYTAGRVLMELIESKEIRSQKVLLRHKLIERGSTAKVM
ncbi:MAG TPA: LacI family DNA-binding transcriptional regulator [Chloroflexia bacterium]|nr:LacI family DNA-binding transcriptional regulator [Chloroflexia bacterium]